MNKKFLGLSLLVIAGVQSVIFLYDHQPMYFFGDSASYIWTAVSGSPLPDRPFLYGYFIRFISLAAKSLTLLVFSQVILAMIICVISGHVLIRYFNVRPWIALVTVFLMTLEPLQLLYTRYVMTETLALFAFVFYVWAVLHYLENPRFRLLIILQALATIMISIRFAFIPLVWICSLAVPIAALPVIAEKAKTTAGKPVRQGFFHVALSVAMLFCFTTVYKHVNGFMQHKPPAYSYESGHFAMGYVMPILEPDDFADKAMGELVLSQLSFPVTDRRARAAHHWMEGGAVWRLKKLEPDQLKADAIAHQAAFNAVIRKPFAFFKLGLMTFTDFFDQAYLDFCMKTELGDRRLEPAFLNLIKTRFNYHGDSSSALDIKSLTGRYFLGSDRWIQFLLFLPLFWMLLLLSGSDKEQRSKLAIMFLFSLTFIGVVIFLSERPVPRYLHIPAWLACMAAGVGLSRIGRYFTADEVYKKNETPPKVIRNINENHGKKTMIGYAVLSLVILLIVLKQTVFFSPTGGMLFGDELIYKENAARIFAGLKMVSVHYPPLYSMLLAPSFLFKNWYDVMIIFNGIVSSLMIVPVWFLARRFMKPEFAAITALISLMIPFHLIYPGYLLSENLFMFLFVGCVLLTLQGSDAGKLQAALFGLALAAAHLTKHIMLPAVLILSLFWIFIPYLTSSREDFFLRFKIIRLNVLLMIFFYLSIYSLWLFYTQTLSLPAGESMGFGISGFKPPLADTEKLILWIAAYASYMVLAVAPFLMVFIASLFIPWWLKFKKGRMTSEAAFGGLLLVLTVCYFMVATNHSFSAGYNAVSVKYLLGRYLMFLTPLHIIAGMIILERVMDERIQLKRWQIVFSALAAVWLFLFAREVLHGGWIWNLPGWFADIEFNSPDAFVYKNKIITSAVAVLTIILGIVLLVGKKSNYAKAAVAVCVILITNYVFVYAGAVQRLPVKLAGLHPRHLAPVLLNQIAGQAEMADFYYDFPDMNERTMHLALLFWGTTYDRERIHSFYHRPEKTDPSDTFLLLSRFRYPMDALLSYKAGGTPFYLYKIDKTNLLPAPEIYKIGPERIIAGKAFNRQPDGSSAIWMKTSNATSWTVIIFQGHALPTTVENPSKVTARVPEELLPAQGVAEVYLQDRLTGQVSNMITVPVVSKEQ